MVPRMHRFLHRFALLTSCGLGLALVGCETIASKPTSSVRGLSESERKLIRESFVPAALPDNPTYVKITQPCIFFVTHPKDGSMVPLGMLSGETYVVLRQNAGSWMDIQLDDGHLGSVISTNARLINEQETRRGDYLQDQPDLEPLALPQASSTGTAPMLDPTLLGG